jgi:Rhodopirellula transposase DDE domain
MSPLRWTSKSTRALATELGTKGFSVTQHTVGAMLGTLGYSLQATRKTLEGEAHPDRDAQFRYINAEAEAFQARGQPVISVDTKKKELVGSFHNRGREWQPAGAPVLTNTHDFPGMATGKAIPYGVYDLATNKALVSVGLDHDTPVFAVNSIRAWWSTMGSAAYPKATELLVTADAGGSNGYRARLWKATLQVLATDLGIAITVVHFPPGTSKWNKIEHRLFSHISLNWRGRPLEDYETVVQLIGSTRTRAGLKVKARLDRRKYPTGKKVSDAVMSALHLTPAAFHGEWNYTLHPKPIA